MRDTVLLENKATFVRRTVNWISQQPIFGNRFREQRPLVEATALHMNNRAQVEAVLNGSIMLGIGYFDSALDEDEREQLKNNPK